MATMGQLYAVCGCLVNRIRPEDMEALDTGRFQEQVVGQPDAVVKKFLCCLAEMIACVFRITTIERDMTGWTCLEPVEAEEGEFEPSLQEFLVGEEKYCGGEEMVKRANKKGARTGLRHAEAMLRNQERIPVEWREHALVFSEVWRGPRGGRGVWCLCWGGGRWYLSCNWLVSGFNSDYRLVASRKVSS